MADPQEPEPSDEVFAVVEEEIAAPNTRVNPGGRRQDDLRGLLRNRWARRAVLFLLPLIGSGLSYVYAQYTLPSRAWVGHVSERIDTMADRDRQIKAVNERVDAVSAQVEANAARETLERREMEQRIRDDIRELRADVRRWTGGK